MSVELGEALGNPDLGPAYRAPIRSDVPVLFISGTLDGRTPVSHAEEVRRGFPHSEHLIVEGGSHGFDLFFFTPKVQEVMQEFLKGQPIPTARVAVSSFPFRPVDPTGATERLGSACAGGGADGGDASRSVGDSARAVRRLSRGMEGARGVTDGGKGAPVP